MAGNGLEGGPEKQETHAHTSSTKQNGGGSSSSGSGKAGLPDMAAAAAATAAAEFGPLPSELGKSLWQGAATQQVVLNIEYMSGFTTKVRSSSQQQSAAAGAAAASRGSSGGSRQPARRQPARRRDLCAGGCRVVYLWALPS